MITIWIFRQTYWMKRSMRYIFIVTIGIFLFSYYSKIYIVVYGMSVWGGAYDTKIDPLNDKYKT